MREGRAGEGTLILHRAQQAIQRGGAGGVSQGAGIPAGHSGQPVFHGLQTGAVGHAGVGADGGGGVGWRCSARW